MRVYSNPWQSARSKRRHPCEKGEWWLVAWREAVQRMSDHRFWAKHPAPFNKTEAGRRRRAEKKFAALQRTAGLQA
jgi:hypothetical protein